jgi:hypothetical protein
MNSNLIPRIIIIDLDCSVKFGRKRLMFLLLFCRNPFVLIFWSKMDHNRPTVTSLKAISKVVTQLWHAKKVAKLHVSFEKK